jgi:hypothetical protein
MLKEMPKEERKRTDLSGVHTGRQLMIKKAEISDSSAKRYQKIAELPEDKFEQIIEETKTEEKELTEALMLNSEQKDVWERC